MQIEIRNFRAWPYCGTYQIIKISDLALSRCKSIFQIFELGLITVQTDFQIFELGLITVHIKLSKFQTWPYRGANQFFKFSSLAFFRYKWGWPYCRALVYPKMAVIFSNSFMSNLQLQERKYAILHDDALKGPLHILLCLSDKLHPNHPRQELLLLSSHLRYLFPKLSVAIIFLRMNNSIWSKIKILKFLPFLLR